MPQQDDGPDTVDAVERFPRTGGWTMPLLAGALVVLLVVTAFFDGAQAFDVQVIAGCVLGLAVTWVVFLRPEVRVAGETLHLRGSLSDVAIPLAAVEKVTITRMLVVQAGARRHVSTSLARTLRGSMTSGGAVARRSGAAGLGLPSGSGSTRADDAGDAGGAVGEHDALGAAAYPDYVEDRLRSLAENARAKRGIRLLSDEQEALAGDVRRSWSRSALGALAGTGLLFVVTLLVF